MPEITVRCHDPENVALTVSATYTLAGWRGVLSTWKRGVDSGSPLTDPVYQLREAISKAIEEVEKRETIRIREVPKHA